MPTWYKHARKVFVSYVRGSLEGRTESPAEFGSKFEVSSHVCFYWASLMSSSLHYNESIGLKSDEGISSPALQ